MKHSTDRILTTHAGSLVRPPEIIAVMAAREARQPYDQAAFSGQLHDGVAEVVREQAAAGVDIPSDGEYGKVGWTNYVTERISGLEARPFEPGRARQIFGKDREDFADFYAAWNRHERTMWLPPAQAAAPATSSLIAWECTGPIKYTGQQAIQTDIANFKAALNGVRVQGAFEDAFLPVSAPGSAEATRLNQYYPSEEAYLYALADALKEEYRAIVDAGLLVQVDDAFLPALYDRLLLSGSLEDYRKFSHLRVEAVNHALKGIPEDRVRYHICWGSWNGPHSTDVPLKEIVDLVLEVNAGAYSIEAANPRHEHEWRVWENVKLPEGKILIPGVVTHSTNIIEHPELVAERITRFARLVGRENVIAGTDCGFSQIWNLIRTHPSIQWAKLRALAEGARLATQQLW
ncbi:MAG TPA: cobalamin-independent methionine synthase II family protein [Dehalococcoidia bacterium]|nr:cobalamin-independent methionine synthase II family protein [Dehalococcoidia bacterium]